LLAASAAICRARESEKEAMGMAVARVILMALAAMPAPLLGRQGRCSATVAGR